MTQWYVKELSKLTDVTVQTLHHYDHIGLLKPSVRLANGYRLYSEKDLLKLQQIIALKFFGFELSQIKTLLSTDIEMLDHFTVQSNLLEKKANTLFEASKALKKIISDCGNNKSIPWETIIQLIEVYRMTQQLENTWVANIFTSDELKEYANFEHDLKKRLSEKEQKAFEQQWENLVAEVDANLDKDPNSQFGITMGKRCMDWVNAYYGKNHAALRNAIWEKGFKTGRMEEGATLTSESFNWLDTAITAYYRARIKNILNQADTQSHNKILQEWEDLLADMHGNDKSQRNKIFDLILHSNEFTQAAKDWLRKYISELPSS